eukprot:GHVN01080723.1.p1 GENE.GHVN01080723.1~~GHVN01080723.1.p1  ORF type:complete len:576 (-),score=78.12 GHVN01080723.1:137-1792(-)
MTPPRSDMRLIQSLVKDSTPVRGTTVSSGGLAQGSAVPGDSSESSKTEQWTSGSSPPSSSSFGPPSNPPVHLSPLTLPSNATVPVIDTVSGDGVGLTASVNGDVTIGQPILPLLRQWASWPSSDGTTTSNKGSPPKATMRSPPSMVPYSSPHPLPGEGLMEVTGMRPPPLSLSPTRSPAAKASLATMLNQGTPADKRSPVSLFHQLATLPKQGDSPHIAKKRSGAPLPQPQASNKLVRRLPHHRVSPPKSVVMVNQNAPGEGRNKPKHVPDFFRLLEQDLLDILTPVASKREIEVCKTFYDFGVLGLRGVATDSQEDMMERFQGRMTVLRDEGVDRRIVGISFRDHKKPWVVCPHPKCVRKAGHSAKLAGQFRFLEPRYSSAGSKTTWEVARCAMGAYESVIDEEDFIAATFCPQQTYSRHTEMSLAATVETEASMIPLDRFLVYGDETNRVCPLIREKSTEIQRARGRGWVGEGGLLANETPESVLGAVMKRYVDCRARLKPEKWIAYFRGEAFGRGGSVHLGRSPKSKRQLYHFTTTVSPKASAFNSTT